MTSCPSMRGTSPGTSLPTRGDAAPGLRLDTPSSSSRASASAARMPSHASVSPPRRTSSGTSPIAISTPVRSARSPRRAWARRSPASGGSWTRASCPPGSGLRIFHAVLRDASGVLECAWPGQAFLDRTIEVGQTLLVAGPVRFYHGRQMAPREFLILADEGEEVGPESGRVLPVYPATEGLSHKIIRGLVDRHLDALHRARARRPARAGPFASWGFRCWPRRSARCTGRARSPRRSWGAGGWRSTSCSTCS